MQQGLFIAVFSGLGGMLGWGLADFFAKKTIDKIGDVTTLFWSQLIGIFPLLLLFLFNPSFPNLSKIDMVYLVILGVWSGLSYIPTYVAFGKGKVSLLSPIFASYAVVVTLLSALLLKEVIPFNRQIAFFIVFIGIFLVSGNPKEVLSLLRAGKSQKYEKVKGLREILLAVCLYSVWLIALDHFLTGRMWIFPLLCIRTFSSVALFIYAKVTKNPLKVGSKSLWKFLFFIGICDVMAFSFVSLGFSMTHFVSIVAMLSGAFSLPTIFLAHIFLKEKASPIQTFGSLIIVLGIIILFIH